MSKDKEIKQTEAPNANTPDPEKEELTHTVESEAQTNPTLLNSEYKFGGGGGTNGSEK